MIPPHTLIEIAFNVWNVPAKNAHDNGNAWGNSDVPHARYLAFRLLSEYNGLIGSEIGQIFGLGRATVNSGLKRMETVLSDINPTWSYMQMKKKYYEAVNIIKEL